MSVAMSLAALAKDPVATNGLEARRIAVRTKSARPSIRVTHRERLVCTVLRRRVVLRMVHGSTPPPPPIPLPLPRSLRRGLPFPLEFPLELPLLRVAIKRVDFEALVSTDVEFATAETQEGPRKTP